MITEQPSHSEKHPQTKNTDSRESASEKCTMFSVIPNPPLSCRPSNTLRPHNERGK